jgi:hypothetical protein
MQEKSFIESKKWLAFVVALVAIAGADLIGFKLGMTVELINAMTSKMMYVSLALILGQSGIDVAKGIMNILNSNILKLASKPATEDTPDAPK